MSTTNGGGSATTGPNSGENTHLLLNKSAGSSGQNLNAKKVNKSLENLFRSHPNINFQS